MPYVIYGTIRRDGIKTVTIAENARRVAYQVIAERAYRNGVITDGMTVECDTLADVRSSLMSDFGPGFFSVAKRRLATLAAGEKVAA